MEQEINNLILTYSGAALALNALMDEYKANPTKENYRALMIVALLTDLATWGFSLDYINEFNSLEEDKN